MGLILRSAAWLFAAAAAAAALALWAVPRHLDWTEYRAEVQRVGIARLGRDVRIDGAFALEMLPQPRLTARGVAIGDSGDGFSGSAEELRLGLALVPLLRGNVVVTDLTLVAPRLRFAGLPAPLWDVLGRPAVMLAGAEVKLERGEVEFGDVRLTSVTARLTSQGPFGAYTAEGRFDIGTDTAEFSLSLGQAGFDGAAPLDARLSLRGASLRASGIAWHGGFAFTGAVTVEGSDFSALLPGPAVPFRAEARLAAEGTVATADQLQLDIGGSRLSGALSLRMDATPRADLALAAVRLDLDPWAVPAAGLIASPPIPVGLDLSVEAASLRGGTVRSLRIAAQVERDQVAVNEASAFLPGGAALSIGGSVSRTESGPRFDGLVDLDAPDLRSLLAWLGVATPASPELLRAARLSGTLVASARELRLEMTEPTSLDGTPFAGTLVLRPGTRPSLTAALRANQIDAARWLTVLPAGPAEPGLAAFDLSLRLEIGAMPAGDFVARDVLLELALDGGAATLRRLAIADIAGGRLELSAAGRLGADARLDSFDLAFSGADVAGLVPLLPWQVVEAARPLWQGGFAVRASARTEPAGLALSAVIEALDARIEAAGTAAADLARFDGRIALRHPGAPRLLSALGLDDPTVWLGGGSAAVVLDLAVDGRRLTLRSAEIGLGGVRARGAGEMVLDPAGPRVAFTLEAETLHLPPLDPRSTEPIRPDLFAGWTAAAVVRAAELSVGGTPWATRLDAALAIADGAIALPRFTAGLGGGTVSGTARFDPPAGRLALEAAINDVVLAGPLFGLPFDLGAGTVSAELRLAASGRSPFALLGSLSGEARLTARDGILVGFDLLRAVEALQGALPVDPAIAEVRAALSEGATAFERAEALIRLERGIATLHQSQLAAAAGTAQVLGEVDLRGRGLDLAIALAPLGAEPLPPLGLRVTGPWTAPQRAVEAAAAARFLAERSQSPR